MTALCPVCGGELIEISPDGATCGNLHRLARDPVTGAYVPAEERPTQAREERDEEAPARRSQADRLIGYALDTHPSLIVDQYGQAHVVVDGVPHALPRGAYPWLRRLMWEQEQRGVTGETLQMVGGTLEALALHQGERVELHVRSAWQDGTLWIWLGPGRVLRIDPSGWRVMHEASVLFRQYPTLGELPNPAPGTTIDTLSDLLDLVAPSERDGESGASRRLVAAWLALAWLPHVARPILLYVGDWGSGKTLRQRMIKRLLDPSKPESIRLDAREIVQKLAHCQVALLDNLGSIPEWAIDTLCRAVTGEGDAKRKLYSDEEDVVFEFRRAVLLNGINPPADRPDFTDRLLPVEMERIPDDQRQEEAAIWARFAERQAAWLGAIATLLSQAMQVYPAVRTQWLPRLADWGRWAMAVYQAAGWGAEQFGADWAVVVERQQAAAIEGSPVAQALLRWMDGRRSWQGTASELFDALTPVADELSLTRSKGWPKSPNWLSRRIRELRPVLLSRGIRATEERVGTERTRLWVLEHTRAGDDPNPEDGPQIPSIPSVPSVSASAWATPADDNADGKRVSPSIPSAIPSARNPHADGHTDDTNATDGISGAFSDAAHRLLAALAGRGRAPVWELAWEAGIRDDEALALAERLVADGLARRMGDDQRAPLSLWSELRAVSGGRR